MAVYYATFSVIAFFLCFYRYFKASNDKKIIAFLCGLVLVFVAGFRYNVGTDYVQYANNYEKYLSEEIELFSQPGLSIIARLCSLVYNDYAAWFLVMSVLTVVPIMYVIHKESISFPMSVIMFIVMGCWHTSFNIVKQSVAMAIIFLGYRFLRERKFIKWTLVCLVASLFHISALIMVPIYFLISSKLSAKRIALIVLVGVAISLAYEYLFDVIDWLKQGEGTTDFDSAVGARTVSFLRILVNFAPLVPLLIYKNNYDWSDPKFAVLVNMSVLNAVLNLFTMNSVYLNRFCIYTSIYNVLLIPYLLKPINYKERAIWNMAIVGLYFVYWSYDLYKCTATVDFYWIFER